MSFRCLLLGHRPITFIVNKKTLEQRTQCKDCGQELEMRYVNDKFSVPLGLSKEGAENYERIFGKDYHCVVCGAKFRSMPGLEKNQQLCIQHLRDLVCP